uniref:Uncharacterized protein n=1 Tax=Rhizophora mucronata TaxID=61149 RepID=A0A2P2P8Z6_RHIMU
MGSSNEISVSAKCKWKPTYARQHCHNKQSGVPHAQKMPFLVRHVKTL